MKDFKRRLISVLIIFFALLLAMTTETGFSLGEKLFLSLGISPWTNGRTGFYLPTIIAFPLFIIGIAEAKRVMSGRHIVIVIIALFLLIPNVLTIIKPVYFSRQSGLAAIEYDLENTIQTNTVIPSANNFRGQGEMMGPDLILFTEDETRLIGNNL